MQPISEKEANKALGELLVIRSSIDAHLQKLVWELGMGLHQNDSDPTESIKEAKAICTCLIHEAKDPLLHNHQGGRGSRGLPGQLTSTITC